MAWWKRTALYPWLIAAYPILFIYGENVGQVAPGSMVPPLIFSMALTAALMLVFRALLGASAKASLMTFIALTVFVTLGHFLKLIEDATQNYPPVIPIAFAVAAGMSAVYYAIKAGRADYSRAAAPLNVVTMMLVLIAASNIIYFSLTNPGSQDSVREPMRFSGGGVSALDYEPDIYYIILDGYPGSDSLLASYGYDNSEFISELRSRGFFVAERSSSNYACTFLSLASSLNMEYINHLSETLGEKSHSRDPATYFIPYEMIHDNRVVSYLKSKNYTFVNHRSGWGPTDDMWTADVQLGPSRYGTNNELTILLIQSTALRIFSYDVFNIAMHGWRNNILHAFDGLRDSRPGTGPKFTFAHIITPHGPYIFDSEGRPVPVGDASLTSEVYEDTSELFVEQVRYVNRRTLQAVDGILEGAENPPVILIQADHGSPAVRQGSVECRELDSLSEVDERHVADRMSILNAYYLPGDGDPGLYDTITPVNTFRVVLNRYFGESLQLLDDRSFYSCHDKYPYEFREYVRGRG